MSSLKKRQHYVWQYYLRPWAANGTIWCKSVRKVEPFRPSLENIGVERYFYEVHELTQEDLLYLQNIILKVKRPQLKELNQGWIDIFQKAHKVLGTLNTVAIDPMNRAEIEKEVRKINRTIVEAFHTETENRAVPILDALRQENNDFFNVVEGRNTFLYYISHQYFRTARMRNSIEAIRHNMPDDHQRTWPIEAFIYATNVAASLIGQGDKYRIKFLQNESEVPFITGDQPVINMLGHKDEQVEFYYPLKPDLAILLTSDKPGASSDRKNISKILVEYYNHGIFRKSASQIYGNDQAYLKDIANLPKSGVV